MAAQGLIMFFSYGANNRASKFVLEEYQAQTEASKETSYRNPETMFADLLHAAIENYVNVQIPADMEGHEKDNFQDCGK